MRPLIEQNKRRLEELCVRYGVRSLAVFGSAACDLDEPRICDLDFLVVFAPMSPTEHADAFFGLEEDLEQLFGMPVDLVEKGSIRNPYFLQAVEHFTVLLLSLLLGPDQ